MIGLEIKKVNFSYFQNPVLRDVSLTIKPCEMVGLLGPNGSGKTTLLKIASGIHRPQEGVVMMGDKNTAGMKRKVIARHLAVVPQNFTIPFSFTVFEIVMLGRIPFIKDFADESRIDHEKADKAIELVEISHLKNRRFDELSGGERQRVILAMALAQEPEILLLDEPTAHLDISHQLHILDLVRKFNREQGLTVLAALHDLNLASLYFDRIVLMKDGTIIADGSTEEVLTESLIENVFHTSVKIQPHPVTGRPQVIITPHNLSIDNFDKS